MALVEHLEYDRILAIGDGYCKVLYMRLDVGTRENRFGEKEVE
jgi:hypothetical protein